MSTIIREADKKISLWSGFRDELVATAMTLSLLVLGSFLVTERMMFRPEVPQSLSPIPASGENNPQTLGIQDREPQGPIPTPELLKPSNASEGSVVFSEVPYGDDGDYDFEGYAISFRNPRITFDAQTNSKRRLYVNVWIKNKNVVDGLDMRLTASIIKDGKVIVPAAALHVPQPKRLSVNEEYSFSASLSLIEGTDVRELKYTPGGDIVEASHFLYP